MAALDTGGEWLDGSSGATAWAEVLASLVDRSHLATGDELSEMVDEAVAPRGLRAEVLVVNLAQRVLTSLRPGTVLRLEVEGTVAGRAFQLGVPVAAVAGPEDPAAGARLLWVPMLDGTERVGVLRLVLGEEVVDDEGFRVRCATLAGLVGHIVMTKLAYSDRLRRLRSDGVLSTAAELLWQLVPPRTFATERVVITALLEPWDRVAGDAYDYAVDDHVVHLAVFDGVGHDLTAGLATALAVTAVRNARRSRPVGPASPGPPALEELADHADRLLTGRPGPTRFVTAVLARLDTRTGVLDYLVAGHPLPLLVRGGHMIKELDAVVRPPLGVLPSPGGGVSRREQLEPGDRLLFYSDGITEARDGDGAFFGIDRLVDLTERTEMARVSAPETLRRLTAAVLGHQRDQLQDDATLLMVDWSSNAHQRVLAQHLDPES